MEVVGKHGQMTEVEYRKLAAEGAQMQLGWVHHTQLWELTNRPRRNGEVKIFLGSMGTPLRWISRDSETPQQGIFMCRLIFK